jgi:ribosomal protein L19
LLKEFPEFKAGDTITVYYEIKEGQKTRTQFFKGTVIQLRGTGSTKTFTIRKMSGDVGVERVFPINMPALQKSRLTEEVELEELESTTSEILEVKKRESKTLLTRRNNSDNNKCKRGCLQSVDSFFFMNNR